jgi:hypothetical protein
MIAAFLTEPNILHSIYAVGLKGLKVKAHGHCSTTANAADGVVQVPDWAFDGRATFQPNNAAQLWAPCQRCANILKTLKEPPR